MAKKKTQATPMPEEEILKTLESCADEPTPYKTTECEQYNYTINRYVVRKGNNVIHKANYESCISAQYISSYIGFDTVEEALAYDPNFRKCKLCFGGDSYFCSKLDKSGAYSDTRWRDKMWEEAWAEAAAERAAEMEMPDRSPRGEQEPTSRLLLDYLDDRRLYHEPCS